jgi:thiol-disulfide isomerase/thioredoxin
MQRRKFIVGGLALSIKVPAHGATASPFLSRHKMMAFTTVSDEKTSLGILTPIGRPAIIHFWASWCAPCAEEMRFLANLSSEMPKNSISLLGIHLNGSGESQEKINAYLERNNGKKYPQVKGNKESYNLFNESSIFGRMITTLPKLFIYDKTGQKIETHSGFDLSAMTKFKKRILTL